MKPLAKFIGAALVGALALLAAPTAQAQVGVNINIGTPAWGPQVPNGTQYYYIPEIDGYYDLYAQQYIVLQDGYWVPLPQLYGYDPYQFHPVVIQYHGREPWLQSSYYHQRYAYQPYCNYGRGGYGNGYYSNGYGRNGYYGNGPRRYNDRNNGRNNGRSYGYSSGYSSGSGNDSGSGNGYNNGSNSGSGSSYGPRGGQPQPGPGAYSDNNGGGPRGGASGQLQSPQLSGGGPRGSAGNSQSNSGLGNSGQGPGGGRHGRD